MPRKRWRPMVEDEIIANQLEALLTPAIMNQEHYYRQLGLRDRILNLPLMVAAVLTLLWRDVPGVTELTRLLAREGFLWCNPTSISRTAQYLIDFLHSPTNYLRESLRIYYQVGNHLGRTENVDHYLRVFNIHCLSSTKSG